MAKYPIIVIIALIILFWPSKKACAVEFNTQNCVRAIIGEASNQGYDGMLAVACGIRNRGTLKGVYGVRAKHVDNEPDWVWTKASQAWIESEDNRIHSGTHWENIKAFGKPYWVDSMEEVYRVKDHIFYK